MCTKEGVCSLVFVLVDQKDGVLARRRDNSKQNHWYIKKNFIYLYSESS